MASSQLPCALQSPDFFSKRSQRSFSPRDRQDVNLIAEWGGRRSTVAKKWLVKPTKGQHNLRRKEKSKQGTGETDQNLCALNKSDNNPPTTQTDFVGSIIFMCRSCGVFRQRTWTWGTLCPASTPSWMPSRDACVGGSWRCGSWSFLQTCPLGTWKIYTYVSLYTWTMITWHR